MKDLFANFLASIITGAGLAVGVVLAVSFLSWLTRGA